MGACPYTFVTSLFRTKKNTLGGVAKFLRVTVEKNNQITVDVSLPAKSARWLIELIPDDVVAKIREENIPIDLINKDLANATVIMAGEVFLLDEIGRKVRVWLE